MKLGKEKPGPAIPYSPPTAGSDFKDLPPAGTEAFQMTKDGSYWSVWAFRVKEGGALKVDKILEREIFDICRQRVLTETIGYQIRVIR